jgi:hypothetical protein
MGCSWLCVMPRNLVSLLLFLLLCASVSADLPHRAGITRPPEVTILRENIAENDFRYRTEHFEFIAPVRMARRLISDLATVFEGTLAAVDALPHGWNPVRDANSPYQVRLFDSVLNYAAAGGIPGSGGFYSSVTREIWVPLDNLGVRRTSGGYTFNPGQDMSLLIHEITHQVTHDWLVQLPMWIVEGIAVFMETVPYRRGEFLFHRYDPRDYLTKLNFDPSQYAFGSLERILNLTSPQWIHDMAMDRDQTRRNYVNSLLLFHFFSFSEFSGEGRVFQKSLRLMEQGSPWPATPLGQMTANPEAWKAIFQETLRRERIRLSIF